ncbi:MAG: hypothetical protein LBM93_10960 [Oscillospiraceae bacterium]|jgi:hypothetical protein|nr:hypothetical protein [Oscillospiraceae bacterium]
MALRTLSDVKILAGNCVNHPGDFTEWKSKILGYYIVAKAMGCKDTKWFTEIEKHSGFMQESVKSEFCVFCKKMFKLFSKIMNCEKDEFYPKFYKEIYGKYVEKQGISFDSFILRALPNGYIFSSSRDMPEAGRLLFVAGVIKDCGVAINRYIADTLLREKINIQMGYILDAFCNCCDKRN